MSSINSVALIGNLTRDVEVRDAGETKVATLRLAFNKRRKVDGEWTEVPGFVNVTVFGRQAENAAQYLSKGRPVGVSGSLEFREYTDKDGNQRSELSILANEVQFLGSRDDSGSAANDSTSGASGNDEPSW